MPRGGEPRQRRLLGKPMREALSTTVRPDRPVQDCKPEKMDYPEAGCAESQPPSSHEGPISHLADAPSSPRRTLRAAPDPRSLCPLLQPCGLRCTAARRISWSLVNRRGHRPGARGRPRLSPEPRTGRRNRALELGEYTPDIMAPPPQTSPAGLQSIGSHTTHYRRFSLILQSFASSPHLSCWPAAFSSRSACTWHFSTAPSLP